MSMMQKQTERHLHKPENLSNSEKIYSHTMQGHRPPFSYWVKKNSYYHNQLLKFYMFVIPQGMRVLQINGKNGYVLDAVQPSWGVGVDADEQYTNEARAIYPHLKFVTHLQDISGSDQFDYIILSSITMETYDIQDLFTSLQPFCYPGTRIVVDTYSYVWEPLLRLTQKLGLRRPTQFKNWLSKKDMHNFLQLADFESVIAGRHTLLPINIPLISWFFNSVLALIPGLNRLCLHEWIIARPMPAARNPHDYVVSVIIPCRNEAGNVEAAIARTPNMGKHTEFIFVEGHSKDNTLDEIKRVVAQYPEKDIRYFVQDGKGKGDAVRKGFAHARGDVLMILDGDLTTPPEEMPKFFDALMQGKGDFINGSRLIYGMEDQAMRFLNLLANHGFSLIFTWLLSQKIKDTLCGTKVLFKKDYEAIVANRAYFGDFDPYGDFDLLFGAAKLNLKIIDMPVHYKNRLYGTSQISRFQGGFLLLMMSFVGLKKFKMR